MRKILIFILLLSILIFGASPYFITYQLQKAYDDKNVTYIIEHTNFEELQYNLKSQFNYRLYKTIAQNPMIEKIGGEPFKIAGKTLIDQTIDNVVTPNGIQSLILSENRNDSSVTQFAAIWLITSDAVDINILSVVQDILMHKGDLYAVIDNQVDLASYQLNDKNSLYEDNIIQNGLTYCGINCFRVSIEIRGFPLDILLKRDGFISWNVVDLTLP